MYIPQKHTEFVIIYPCYILRTNISSRLTNNKVKNCLQLIDIRLTIL